MRVLDPKTAADRKRRLLQAVIYHYMRTGKPVGSQVIVDKYNFGMSSATIRNMLLDLDKEGYLVQPHTSAGLIRHKVLPLSRPMPPDRLSMISDMLNERLKGLPLSEVRTQILHHIEALEQEQSEAFSLTRELARELARDAFDLKNPDGEVYI